MANLDDTVIEGGWLDGNFKQLGYQIAATLAIGGWSFVVTYIILFVIDSIPRLGFRLPHDQELLGGDMAQVWFLIRKI